MRSPRRAGAARLDEAGSERRDVPAVAFLAVFLAVLFFAALFFAALFFAGTARLLTRTVHSDYFSGARAEPQEDGTLVRTVCLADLAATMYGPSSPLGRREGS